MDIVSALRDLKELHSKKACESLHSFLAGYGSEVEIDDGLVIMMPRFKRYINLLLFARIIRSVKGSNFQSEPDWVAKLKIRLEEVCNEYRRGFDVEW